MTLKIQPSDRWYTISMKIIIGLGNPEPKYDGSRHNIGFWVLDWLADHNDVKFTASTKFVSELAEYRTKDDRVLLVKPQTYYNLTGEAAQKLAQFYHVEPYDILVIHDDLALPIGTIRTRAGGSDAGNNGVKSLNQHLGTNTKRLRIGTWSDQRDRLDDVAFVLGKFSADETKTLESELPTINKIVNQFTSGSFETTTYHA